MSRSRSAAVRHPLFARFYARVRPCMDKHGGAERRQRLLADLAGDVVEVGAGDGANFSYFPAAVTSVLAVEPEPYLRELAQAAARRAQVPVQVVDGVAERLPLPDASVDAAIASLMLCSVRDQSVALAEMRRVVRPGGELRFVEHVQAPPEQPRMRTAQRLLDATMWPLLCGGCHCGRDTVAAVQAAGFELEQVERFRFPEGAWFDPTSPCALGRATRR